MKRTIHIAVTAILALASATVHAKPLKVYILAGQSNMQGLAAVQTLAGMAADPQTKPLYDKIVDAEGNPREFEDVRMAALTGKLYDEMLRNVRRALGDKSPASVTFIWMQGEADAESGWAASYEKSFLGLLERIKADLGVGKIHFVVGRINDFWLEKQDGKAIRDILAKLGDDHANGAWIDTDDLNRGVNPWGGFSFEDGHFPPAGYVIMGQRFARQACLLLDPDLKTDPAIFAEHFIDSHEQIREHAATGKKSEAHPSLADFETRAPLLTDGKFGPADSSDTAWLAIPPSEQPVEFVNARKIKISIETGNQWVFIDEIVVNPPQITCLHSLSTHPPTFAP